MARPETASRRARANVPVGTPETSRPAAPPPQLAIPGLERDNQPAPPPGPAMPTATARDLMARIERDLRAYNTERSRRD